MPYPDAAIRRALARARGAKALDVDEAVALLHARGEQLDALCEVAGRVRDAGLLEAGRPGTVTYSPKVFIPLTRLCRDRCHYCTFATTPGNLAMPYLDPDSVLAVARAGVDRGCKEALFTLGDRPEDRWAPAREWLAANGYDSTLGYLRAMAILVLEETGLLPHLNPGVMAWDELTRLKPVAPSMGLMLESTSRLLVDEVSGCHHGSPDKDPDIRLRVIEEAGRLAIPFTTGILVGIGETLADRIESLLAIRASARRFGHVQEVIVQNFRAKPQTAMRDTPDAEPDDYLATVAVARLLLGPAMRLQVPPNLSEPAQLQRLLSAGVDDWGGVSPVTPDHVNPERPWPEVDELRRQTAAAGFRLAERLTVHPEYVRRGAPWLDPRIQPHVLALADSSTGLAHHTRSPTGTRWQEPDSTWASQGRTELHVAIDSVGRTDDRRGDFDDVYGSWVALREQLPATVRSEGSAAGNGRIDPAAAAALRAAEQDPAGITDDHALTLAHADGPELRALAELANSLRREAVGDTVTYVVNRNINFTNVCYTGCRFCAFAQRRTDSDAYTLSLEEVADRAEQAWHAGATEVCMQGGIDPDLPGTAYFDLAEAVKNRVPGIHLHAFSPMEVVNGAARTGLSIHDFLVGLREAGVDSIPGTAAEILDDEVRWILTRGKLPTSSWIEVVTTAHEIGLPSSSTMMYGHVDTPAHWVGHLRVIAEVQRRTGGFTEFVPLPFVHQSSPIYLAGVARPGPTRRDNVAAHALARVMLHGLVDHVQTSWVKLGDEGTRMMLRSGADDLGGTLMEETISRMAGSQHGSARTPEQLAGMADGRPVRQRTTTYAAIP